jgi:hypothetical protein
MYDEYEYERNIRKQKWGQKKEKEKNRRKDGERFDKNRRNDWKRNLNEY